MTGPARALNVQGHISHPGADTPDDTGRRASGDDYSGRSSSLASRVTDVFSQKVVTSIAEPPTKEQLASAFHAAEMNYMRVWRK